MVSKELVAIRKLRISDIYTLNKMYDSLSEESMRFFHPGFLGLKSISFGWVLAQFALAASSFAFFRKVLLHIYPPSVFLAIVSTKFGEITGFAFVKVKSRNKKMSHIKELGIFVRDCWQGRGIGTELMKHLLELAKKEFVQKIHLTVLANNFNAMHMYEKYGFKQIRMIPKGDVWRGKRFDCIEMLLELY